MPQDPNPLDKLASFVGADYGKARGYDDSEDSNQKSGPYDALLDEAAAKYGVDPKIVRAIAHQESGQHARAVSPKGASGIMQLMPGTARDLGVKDIFDPKENIDAGVRYFKQQLDRFGSVPLALAGYNAGPTAVEKAGRAIPHIPETQKYVNAIQAGLKNMGAIGNLTGKLPGPPAENKLAQFIGGIKPAPIGQIDPGNIDLGKRPVVTNPDGSISTVRSMSANIDGKEVLIPTVSDDGRIMSDDEAIENYKITGKHLGTFDTPENATSAANRIHEQQAQMHGEPIFTPQPVDLPQMNATENPFGNPPGEQHGLTQGIVNRLNQGVPDRVKLSAEQMLPENAPEVEALADASQARRTAEFENQGAQAGIDQWNAGIEPYIREQEAAQARERARIEAMNRRIRFANSPAGRIAQLVKGNKKNLPPAVTEASDWTPKPAELRELKPGSDAATFFTNATTGIPGATPEEQVYGKKGSVAARVVDYANTRLFAGQGDNPEDRKKLAKMERLPEDEIGPATGIMDRFVDDVKGIARKALVDRDPFTVSGVTKIATPGTILSDVVIPLQGSILDAIRSKAMETDTGKSLFEQLPGIRDRNEADAINMVGRFLVNGPSFGNADIGFFDQGRFNATAQGGWSAAERERHAREVGNVPEFAGNLATIALTSGYGGANEALLSKGGQLLQRFLPATAARASAWLADLAITHPVIAQQASTRLAHGLSSALGFGELGLMTKPQNEPDTMETRLKNGARFGLAGFVQGAIAGDQSNIPGVSGGSLVAGNYVSSLIFGDEYTKKDATRDFLIGEAFRVAHARDKNEGKIYIQKEGTGGGVDPQSNVGIFGEYDPKTKRFQPLTPEEAAKRGLGVRSESGEWEAGSIDPHYTLAPEVFDSLFPHGQGRAGNAAAGIQSDKTRAARYLFDKAIRKQAEVIDGLRSEGITLATLENGRTMFARIETQTNPDGSPVIDPDTGRPKERLVPLTEAEHQYVEEKMRETFNTPAAKAFQKVDWLPREQAGGLVPREPGEVPREFEKGAVTRDLLGEKPEPPKAKKEKPQKTEESPKTEAPVASPERAAATEKIVAAARKPPREIVETFELKGTDGKWHTAHSFPHGVKMTGERRSAGFVQQTPEGVQVGSAFKTREEAEHEQTERLDRSDQNFRESLNSMTDSEWESQYEFWLKKQFKPSEGEVISGEEPPEAHEPTGDEDEELTEQSDDFDMEDEEAPPPEPAAESEYPPVAVFRVESQKTIKANPEAKALQKTAAKLSGSWSVGRAFFHASLNRKPIWVISTGRATDIPPGDWVEVANPHGYEKLFAPKTAAAPAPTPTGFGDESSRPKPKLQKKAAPTPTPEPRTAPMSPEDKAKIDALMSGGRSGKIPTDAEAKKAAAKRALMEELGMLDDELSSHIDTPEDEDAEAERLSRAVEARASALINEITDARSAGTDPAPMIAKLRSLGDKAAAFFGEEYGAWFNKQIEPIVGKAPATPPPAPDKIEPEDEEDVDTSENGSEDDNLEGPSGTPDETRKGKSSRSGGGGGRRRGIGNRGKSDLEQEDEGDSGTGVPDGAGRGAESDEGDDSESGRPGDLDDYDQAAGSDTRSARSIALGEMFRGDDTDVDHWLNNSGKMKKFEANLAAIDLARDLISVNQAPSPEQRAVLARYTGWGQFPEVFNEDNEKTASMRAELQTRLDPDQFAAARASTLNAHFTSPGIIKEIWRALGLAGFKGGRILEPAMGTGNFFGWMPDGVMQAAQTRMVGIELDTTTAQIARLLYPGADVFNTGFEDAEIKSDTFDLAISNVPFGDYSISSDKAINTEYGSGSGLLIHNYFFAKAIDAVRPGGLIAFVTSTGTMDSRRGRAMREKMTEKAEFVGAVRLPGDAFEKNAGTSVTTDIIIMRKRGGPQPPIENAPYWLETGQLWRPPGMSWQEGQGKFHGNLYYESHPENALGEWTNSTLYAGDRLALKSRPGQKTNALLRTRLESIIRGAQFSGKKLYVSATRKTDSDPLIKDKKPTEIKIVMEGRFSIQPDKEVIARNEEAVKSVPVGLTAYNAAGLDDEKMLAEYGVTEERAPNGAIKLTGPAKALNSIAELFEQHADAGSGFEDSPAERKACAVSAANIRKATAGEKAPDRVYIETADGHEALDVSKPAMQRIRDFITLRDALRTVLDSQVNGLAVEERDKARNGLKAAYKAFVAANGNLYQDKVIRTLAGDPEFPLALALESKDADGNITVNKDIFERDVVSRYEPPETATDAEDAVRISLLEYDRIDIPRVAGLLGMDEAEAREAIISANVGFFDPVSKNIEPAEEYLSGNLLDKIKAVKRVLGVQPELKRNIEALEAAMPTPKPAKDIAIKLGAPFVDPADMERFADEILGVDVKIQYRPATATWLVLDRYQRPGAKRRRDERLSAVLDRTKATIDYGTSRMASHELLQLVLNNGKPRIYSGSGEGRVFDARETSNAEQRMEKMQNAFTRFMQDDKDRAARLEKTFNENFNVYRPRTFSTERLQISGVSTPILEMLRGYQNSGARQIGSGMNSLMAHEPGAGKTLTAAVGAALLRQRGMAKKVAFVALPSTLAQIEAEMRRAAPDANILVADDKNFEKKKRRAFVAKIATSNHDIVIFPYQAFEKVAVRPERYVAYLEEMRRELTADINEMRKSTEKGNRVVKQLESQRKKIEEKIKKEQEKMAKRAASKDRLLWFEDLGFDAMIVDESHNFKNLPYHSKHGRVAGIGGGTGSNRALDMFLKTQILNEIRGGDRGVTFLTGTPVTNTLGELYTIMRMLAPRQLEKLGLGSFDAWANTFAMVRESLEPGVTGRFRRKSSFSEFQNLFELSRLVRMFTDIQTSEMLQLPKPELEGGKPIVVRVPMTAEQIAYMADLDKRVDGIKARGGRAQKGEDNMLSVSSDGRLVALDPRLVMPSAPGEGTKVEHAADNIFRIYKEGMEKKTTQLVFADLGTPNDTGKFSVYEILKQALVDRGIPPNQIAFFQDYDTDARRFALFKKFNAGDIRVLVGTTLALGTGTNPQRLVQAVHHLTIPWRPTDLEQANARMLRQGNLHLDWNETVREFRYVLEGTKDRAAFDAYQWGLLKRKTGWIKQFWRGEVDKGEDVGGRAETEDEWIAIASGNPIALERVAVMRQIDELERKRIAFDDQQHDVHMKIAHLDRSIDAQTKRLAGAKLDAAAIEGLPTPEVELDEKGRPLKAFADRDRFLITVGKHEPALPKDAAEVIATNLDGYREVKERDNLPIAKVGPFKISVSFKFNTWIRDVQNAETGLTEKVPHSSWGFSLSAEQPGGGDIFRSSSYSNTDFASADDFHKTNAERVRDGLYQLNKWLGDRPEAVLATEERIEDYKAEREDLVKRISTEGFEDQAELDGLKARLEQIDYELGVNKDESGVSEIEDTDEDEIDTEADDEASSYFSEPAPGIKPAARPLSEVAGEAATTATVEVSPGSKERAPEFKFNEAGAQLFSAVYHGRDTVNFGGQQVAIGPKLERAEATLGRMAEDQTLTPAAQDFAGRLARMFKMARERFEKGRGPNSITILNPDRPGVTPEKAEKEKGEEVSHGFQYLDVYEKTGTNKIREWFTDEEIDTLPHVDKLTKGLAAGEGGEHYRTDDKRVVVIEGFAKIINEHTLLGLTAREALDFVTALTELHAEKYGPGATMRYTETATPRHEAVIRRVSNEARQRQAKLGEGGRGPAQPPPRNAAQEGATSGSRVLARRSGEGIEGGQGEVPADEDYVASFFGRGQVPVPASPKMDRIIKAQTEHANPSLLRRLIKAYNRFAKDQSTFSTEILNMFSAVDLAVDRTQMSTGILPPSANPTVINALTYGGASGVVEAAMIRIARVQEKAKDEGLGEAYTRRLNLEAYQRAYDTKREHVADKIVAFAEHMIDNLPARALQALETAGVLTQQERVYLEGVQTGRRQSPTVPVPSRLAEKLYRASEKIWNAAIHGNVSPRQYVSLTDRVRTTKKDVETLKSRIANAEIVPEEYTEAEIAQELSDMEQGMDAADWTRLTELTAEVYEISRRMLDLVHSEGVVSTRTYNKLIARGDKHVPLNRILEDLDDARDPTRPRPLYVAQQQILHQLLGSKKVNVDPTMALMATAAEMIREAARNKAARTLVNMRLYDPLGFGQGVMQLKAGQKPDPGMGVLPVWIDGKKTYWQVPEHMATEMELATAAQVEIIGGTIINFFNQAFKGGATAWNLAFALPNFIRDIGDWMKYGENAPRAWRPEQMLATTYRLFASFYHIIRQDEKYLQWLESGSAYSTIQKGRTPEAFLGPFYQTYGRLASHTIAAPITLTAKVVNALEETTKMTAWHRAMKLIPRGSRSPLALLRAAWGASTGPQKSFIGWMRAVAANLPSYPVSPEDVAVAAAYESRTFGGSPDWAIFGAIFHHVMGAFPFARAASVGTRRYLRWVLGRDLYMPGARGGIGMSGAGGKKGAYGRIIGEPGPGKNAKVSDARRGGAAMMRHINALIGVLIAAMAYYAYNIAGHEDEYEKRSEAEKNKNFSFFIGPETDMPDGPPRQIPYTFPMAHWWQMYFPLAVEMIYHARTGKGDIPKALEDAITNLSPINVNRKEGETRPRAWGRALVSNATPILRVPIEEFANWDTYRDQAIEYPWMEDVDPELGYIAGRTSPTAISIAQFNKRVMETFTDRPMRWATSPVRVEHAIKGFFAGLGDNVLATLDAMRDDDWEAMTPEQQTRRSLPVIGAIMRRFKGSAFDQKLANRLDQFYSDLKDTETAARSFTRVGTTDGPEQAKAYLDNPKNAVKVAYAQELRRAAETMAAIRADFNTAAHDPNRTPDERRERLQRDGELLRTILQRAEQVHSILVSKDAMTAKGDETFTRFLTNQQIDIAKFGWLEQMRLSPEFRQADPERQKEYAERLRRTFDDMKLDFPDLEGDAYKWNDQQVEKMQKFADVQSTGFLKIRGKDVPLMEHVFRGDDE